MMKFLYQLCWLLCALRFKVATAEEGFKPVVNPLFFSPRANNSIRRSLSFDEEDILSREAGFGYQYPLAPPPYAPPVYGPPPEYPDQGEGSVSIEFFFNELTIECIVEKPLEHVIWTRYPCPNQVYFGEGIHVADGAVVYNEDLYDIRVTGFNGVFFSELTIRDPTGPDSSGLYRCEAWPHIHKNGNGYQPYGTYNYYTPVESDVFIIGGNSLLENCYGNLPVYGSYGNKVSQAATNKKPNIDANKISKIKENFKLRRNISKNSVDRKDANAKYLRYNIKFDNSHASGNANKSVTVNAFLPNLKYPSQSRYSDVMSPPKGPVTPQLTGNATSSIRFDFLGNGDNKKTWQSKYLRSNLQLGKGRNLTVESLARKSVFPRNQTESR